jgi:thymidylate synthase (FAD)
MNARALHHFFQVRCCLRAQWEIRRMAELLLIEVRGVAPQLFEMAGPTCITDGYCSEGEMTCGRLKAIK